jgi:hypothetical protein
MDLTTNGVIVTDAIKYVQSQVDHLSKTEKSLLQDIKENSEVQKGERKESGEETLITGFFDQQSFLVCKSSGSSF